MVTGLVSQVGELKTELGGHEASHVSDARSRAANARWLTGTLIALAALMVAILALLFQVLGKVH
jgi:hypothetical protein